MWTQLPLALARPSPAREGEPPWRQSLRTSHKASVQLLGTEGTHYEGRIEPEDPRRCRSPRCVSRRRLHLHHRPLPHDEPPADRALLPLPLVPARDRGLIRAQRADRVVPRRPLEGRARDRQYAVQQREGAKDLRAVLRAGSRSIATMAEGPTPYASSASEPSTSRTASPQTSTSTRHRSSHGSVLPQGAKAVPDYYKSAEVWPPESLERRAALKP